MRGPSHVLSLTGEWVDFEYLDPAAVEAVKALLDANIPSSVDAESGSFPSTTEVGPALRKQPDPVASTYVGGADDG